MSSSACHCSYSMVFLLQAIYKIVITITHLSFFQILMNVKLAFQDAHKIVPTQMEALFAHA